jgi:hypothetical protein
MLTIIAWIVFIPAIIWNIILFSIAFGDTMGDQKIHWLTRRNMRDITISLLMLFIPGIYLFGVF